MSKNTNLSFLTDFLTADIVNSRVGMNNVSPQSTFDVAGTGKFSGILTLGSTVSNGTYTYTLPSATGTLALTSDIPSVSGYVPYTGANQSVDLGYNSLAASFLRVNGTGPTLGSYLGFKHSTNVTTGADGYTSIYTFGTNTIGFKSISGATTRDFSFSMASITPGVPGGRTYTLPDADGTIALASAIPANPVGGTGTLNTIPKFTAATTIGNSNIFDSGSIIYNTNPAAGTFAWQFGGSTVTGQSYGAQVVAGTNASDIGFKVMNAAASINYLVVRGDGNVGIGTGTIVNSAGYARILNVYDSSSAAVGISIASNDYQLGVESDGGFRIRYNGTTRLTIASTGAATFSSTLACSGAFIQLNQTELIASTGASNRAYAISLGNTAAGDFVIMQGSTATGGTYTSRLAISPTGNVGIGTAIPVSFGSGYTSTDIRGTNGGGILFGITSGVNGQLYADATSTVLFSTGARPFQLYVNSGLALTLASTGEATFSQNVSVGVSTLSNPNSLNRLLQVRAAAPVGVVLFDSRDANPIGLENRGAVFHLTYGTSNILVADGASGKVSIGTASISAYLDIVAPAGVSSPTVLRTYSNQHGLGFKSVISGTYTTIETNNTSYPLVFNPSGGNVLIGTTTDSGGKLRVDGDVFINNSSNAQIGFNTTGAVGATGAYLYFNRSSVNKWTAGMGPADGSDNYQIVTGGVKALQLTVTTGAATFSSQVAIGTTVFGGYPLFLKAASGDTLIYGLSSNGTFSFDSYLDGTSGELHIRNGSRDVYLARTAGTWVGNSDKTIKENITLIQNSLEKVLQLNGYYYNLIDDKEKNKRVGVIAQEVEKVLPEATHLSYNKTYERDIMGVEYDVLIPLLINAIKELNEKINK
jgi:hypothetical protein